MFVAFASYTHARLFASLFVGVGLCACCPLDGLALCYDVRDGLDVSVSLIERPVGVSSTLI